MTSKLASHIKIPCFSMIFHHFSNSMIFPCMEFFKSFSRFSRAHGKPEFYNSEDGKGVKEQLNLSSNSRLSVKYL